MQNCSGRYFSKSINSTRFPGESVRRSASMLSVSKSANPHFKAEATRQTYRFSSGSAASSSMAGPVSFPPITAMARLRYGSIAADSSRSSAPGSVFRSPIGICLIESSPFVSSTECPFLSHSDCSAAMFRLARLVHVGGIAFHDASRLAGTDPANFLERRFWTASQRISDQFLDAYDTRGGVGCSGMAPQLRMAWRELHRPLRIGNPNA
jgi:hypothetical protein